MVNHARAIAILAVAVLALLPLVSGASVLPRSEGAWTPEVVPAESQETDPSFVYPIDPEFVKQQFRETGGFAVNLPNRGEVQVEANEEDFFVEGRWFTIDDSRQQVVDNGPLPLIAVRGSVVGEPDSRAVIVLGEFGIYGRIESMGQLYFLDPFAGALGTYFQSVSNRTLDSTEPQSAVKRQSLETMGWTVTEVAFDVEKRYQDTHPDWLSRVTGAFQQQKDMWYDVGLDMQLSGPYGLSYNILTNDNCDGANDVAEQYRSWLAGKTAWYIEAYLLWTSLNLDEGGINAASYGCSWEDQLWQGAGASGVVEGTNFCCDQYDANSAYERGLVAGHELSHIYGEEEHPNYCRTPTTDCNIMRRGIDMSNLGFYWWDHTWCEINYRFYSNDECP